MARRVLGSQFDADTVNSIEFRTAVLDDLIQRRLLGLDAESAGFRVGDDQLAQFIKNNPRFQTDGQFDSAMYQQSVQSLGYTKVGFEAYLRQQNVLQQLQQGMMIGMVIPGRRELNSKGNQLQQSNPKESTLHTTAQNTE